jgi:hypothetical protein
VGSLADKIRHARRAGLDTSLFIFYLEDHPRYLSLCDEVFDLLEQGGAEIGLSAVSYQPEPLKACRRHATVTPWQTYK